MNEWILGYFLPLMAGTIVYGALLSWELLAEALASIQQRHVRKFLKGHYFHEVADLLAAAFVSARQRLSRRA